MLYKVTGKEAVGKDAILKRDNVDLQLVNEHENLVVYQLTNVLHVPIMISNLTLMVKIQNNSFYYEMRDCTLQNINNEIITTQAWYTNGL